MARVLVCGGRDYGDAARVFSVLDEFHGGSRITAVVTGAAPGADTLAERWARERRIPVERYPADWKAHGRAAGPIRNARMLDEARPDAVVAFPGGRGTADMVSRATKADVPVVVIGAPSRAPLTP